jgi:hypothetical protein
MIDENPIDVDQLLSEVEKPADERPMSASESADDRPVEQAPQASEWKGDDWAFDWNGKKIVPDSRDKAMQWQSLGYNYSQRVSELNKTHAQRMAEIEEKAKSYQGFDRYGEVDRYAKENPDWWQHVQSAYQSRGTQQINPELQPVLNPLLERLQATESVLSQWQQDKQRQEIEQQDKALDADIQSTREAYPTIDLDAVDPATGETLELRVLKHARELGTQNFKTAFRDYFHDKLIEMAKTQALETAAKEKQDMAKKGILGRSPTPTKGINPATNFRQKSYDQLTQEALAELGIS